MNVTSVNNTAITLPSAAQTQELAPTQAEMETDADADEKPASTRVTISDLGQILSAKGKAATKNQDIDSSSLPDTIKDLLKRIRQIKEQIQEQQQKLNAIMANQKLSPEEKQKQLFQVQATISSLSGALTSAYGQLEKTMRDQDLTQDQQIAAASLLAS